MSRLSNYLHGIKALAPIMAAFRSVKFDAVMKIAEEAALRYVDTTLADEEKRTRMEAMLEIRLRAAGIDVPRSVIHAVVGLAVSKVQEVRAK